MIDRSRHTVVSFALAGVVLSSAALTAQVEDHVTNLRSLIVEVKGRLAAGDEAAARAALARGTQVADSLDDLTSGACEVLMAFARAALDVGEVGTALRLAERVVAGHRVGDATSDAFALQAYDLIGRAKDALGDRDGALQHFQDASAALSRTRGADDRAVLRLQLRVAFQSMRLGRVSEAVAIAENALERLARQLPDDDVDLNLARTWTADVLSAVHDGRSLALYEKALPILERKLPADDEALESARFNHAVALANLGDFEQPRSIWERVLSARRHRLPEHHPSVLVAQQNLMVAYVQLGDARRALELGTQVLAVRSRIDPPGHPELLNLCTNLASLRSTLGDVLGAQDLLQRVVQASEGAHAASRQHLARALTGLATVKFNLGDADTARTLVERARELQSDLREDLPEVLHTMQVLACAQAGHGDKAAGLALGAHVVEVFTRSYPDDWHGQYEARANFAQIKSMAGDFAAARDLLRLPPQLMALGDDNPNVTVARGQLGASHLALGEFAEATTELRAAVRGYAAQIDTASEVLSPVATEIVNATLAEPISELLSATVDSDPHEAAQDLQCVIAVRGHSERRASFAAAVRTAAARDQEVERRLHATLTARARLRNLRSDASEQEALRVADLAAAQAEESLAQALSQTSNTRLFPRMSLADLRARLPADSAVVLTVTYARTFPVRPRRPIADVIEHVVCFVVTTSGVRRIELGEGKPIAAAVNSLRFQLRHGNEVQVQAEARKAATALRDVIASLPAGIRQLLVCPDGVLATIPWEALPSADGESLGDRVRVTYADNLTTLQRQDVKLHPPSLLAVGDVDFEADVPAETAPDGPAPAIALRGDARHAALPGAKAEIDGVTSAFAKAHSGAKSELLSGASACRARVVKSAPRFRYIHFATHADAAANKFWERMAAPTGVSPPAIDRGLLARLVLAGANKQQPGTMETCMLTASEIAELDLSGCELAVLSACDTNVGERWFGEALTGLNRSLQLAGVQHTITTLWKVRDEGAQAFFAAFYARLWEKREREACSVAEAMAHARAAVKSQGFGPDVWACFVHYGPLTGR